MPLTPDTAFTDLEREYATVVGRPLDEPELDVFDLGLASMAVLELISRLRGLGYEVRMDDFVNAGSMREVARTMAGTGS
ncbi:acyl carrier protein [Amycolatopsis sp. PS_44_ISF1]|uniref:acyl carrier protein n=1 Tax=Amycolatopsis sp. PS_44_ISF1 TaxID=2974917 RepID=UPI0028DE9F44|nr:acyl carrier protein [Amycolatopsis sp. PS_44_ISF1]MDT8914982.1 acyl carrier protein [Amycolatopsis sp. PS_44_ISF1]